MIEGHASASVATANSAQSRPENWSPSAHITVPGHCGRLAVAAPEPLGDQPSGLACAFLNVAPQLLTGLVRPLNSLPVQLGSGPQGRLQAAVQR